MSSTQSTFTVREWVGVTIGVVWGLVLSRFFAADDMTGPWLVILFGPPVVLLISPSWPILSWQLPIVTAAFAGTVLNRTADDSAGGAFAEGAITWFICSVLSSPWALMFHHRSRRFRQLGRTPGIPIAYVGMMLLVLLCCALTLVGFAMALGANDAQNRMLPLYGLLMATGGIVLSLLTERVARRLEVQKLVRGVFELTMIPGVVMLAGFAMVGIASLFGFRFPDEHPSLDENVLCGLVVSVEATAAMLWLTRLDRHEKRLAVPVQ